MKIGIIGASGKAGHLILKEALDRGHDVSAIVRDKNKITEKVDIIEKDIFNISAEDVRDFDVVINAFGAPLGEEEAHVDAGHALIEALKGTDTKAVIVGGAGSLFVDEEKTTRMSQTPDFPDAFLPTANGQERNLLELEKAKDIRWTFISPAAMFDAEGKRTGSYTLGKDHVITNAKGDSYISYADYAIAVLDEIEKPQHINTRFTVVGEAE